MRAARREALLGLGIRDRRFGWPLEMVLRAAAAGWTIREVAVVLPPARRPVEGHRHGRGHRPRGAGHDESLTVTPQSSDPNGASGTLHQSVRPALLVIAKAPVPGRVKTRSDPPVHAGTGRRARARGAAGHPRRRGRRARAPAAACVALDGEPGPVAAAPASRSSRSAATAWPSASPPRSTTSASPPSWSAWTRRRSRRSCSTPGSPRSPPAARPSAPALDGGYWGIGLRTPDRARVRRACR